MADLKWYSFRVVMNKMEVDVKGSRKIITSEFRKLLILSVQHLIEDTIPDQYKDLKPVVAKLFERKRFKAYIDSHLSVFYGPKTPRLSFSVSRMNIFPTASKLPTGNFTLKLIGKSSTIGDKKTNVKASIDAVITVVELPECDVESEAFYHPGWFCGEIEIPDVTKPDTTTTIKEAKAATVARKPGE